MNIDLILMLGTLILLAISGLLVFCFTESKGKNTPHARRYGQEHQTKAPHTKSEDSHANNNIGLEKTLV